MGQFTLSSGGGKRDNCRDQIPTAKQVLASGARMMGAQAGTCFEFMSDGSRLTHLNRLEMHGRFRDACNAYGNGLYRNDPLFRTASGQPCTLRYLVRKFGISENHSRYGAYFRSIAGSNIGDIIGFYFDVASLQGSKTVMICFLRDCDTEPFSDEDYATFTEMMPMLVASWKGISHQLDVELLDDILSALARDLEIRIQLQDRSAVPRAIWGEVDASRVRPTSYPNGNRIDGISLPHGMQLIKGRITDHRSECDLTRREWDVIVSLRNGSSNSHIAASLGISVRTVENHLRAIFRKLAVNSRTQALAKLAS